MTRLVRSLWVLKRSPADWVTAAIFEHEYGHELRVYADDDPDRILNSYVADNDEMTLLLRADALKELLESRGWSGRS